MTVHFLWSGKVYVFDKERSMGPLWVYTDFSVESSKKAQWSYDILKRDQAKDDIKHLANRVYNPNIASCIGNEYHFFPNLCKPHTNEGRTLRKARLEDIVLVGAYVGFLVMFWIELKEFAHSQDCLKQQENIWRESECCKAKDHLPWNLTPSRCAYGLRTESTGASPIPGSRSEGERRNALNPNRWNERKWMGRAWILCPGPSYSPTSQFDSNSTGVKF